MIVTIIGEICFDIFVYGEVKRMCPEAPVPILTNLSLDTNMGMAGNVRRNILSYNPSYETRLINQKQTIRKTRYVDEKTNHMFLRVDEGDDDVDKLVLTPEKVEEIIESDIVIVSDYNKGFLDEKTIVKIGKMSKFSVIDTKKTISEDIIESFDFITKLA